MKIETTRLILRTPLIKDAQEIANNGNEKELSYLTYYLPYPLEMNEALKLIKESKQNTDLFRFGIFIKSEKKVVGLLDLYNLKKEKGKIKIGYWIGKNYRRKGYVSEAILAGIKFAFEKLKVRKIVAKVLIDNLPSQKMLEKLNFQRTKVIPGDKFIDGKRVDTITYELNK